MKISEYKKYVHVEITHEKINTLQWRHNGPDGVSNHQPDQFLLIHLFGRRPKKTSKLRVITLCVGNSSGTGEFPAQMASNVENVSIWWRFHDYPRKKNSFCADDVCDDVTARL